MGNKRRGRSMVRSVDPSGAEAGSGVQTRQPRRLLNLSLVAVAVLAVAVALALGLAVRNARGEEAASEGNASQVEASLPTSEQTKEVLGSPRTTPLDEQPETNPQTAVQLPHRELERDEALELTEGVFGDQLESQSGIYDELEPEKFLSDYAAVVSSSSLPEPSGSAPSKIPTSAEPEQDVLLESTLPLRAENAKGQEEAVDLSLESSGQDGELRPQNPLTDVGIPAELGEGVSLPDAGVRIEVLGAPEAQTPTNVEDEYAFYPNISQNTDLIVAPTPTGVDVMTSIRSAEASTSTTYRLSIPPGDSLQSDSRGGAEVVQNGRTLVAVPPPAAMDAAGNSVPTQMQIEGNLLTVSVAPEPSTAFPILVDPEVIGESWNWIWNNEPVPSPSIWHPSTTTASYQPLPYAGWGASYLGLDLTSGYAGPAYSGTHADWSYWVPRYYADVSKYGSPPTSWVSSVLAQSVLFLPWGNYQNYPALVFGLIDPSVGWAVETKVHYGGEGELAGWNNWILLTNTSATNIKGADMNLVTYEEESQAKRRDAFIGQVGVVVHDDNAPVISLPSPAGWATGSSAKIPYVFTDTGLGVRSADVRVPGATSWIGSADFHCAGTNASPCPREVKSTEAKATALTYPPNQLPTGEDQLEVVVGDPFWTAGHTVSGETTVKVDNTPPEISLSGPLTEEEKLGTHQTEYPLVINATDGEEEASQSGIKKVEVKVDGKKITMPNETPWHPSCGTQNCSFSGGWTLKAAEYAPGIHEVEVLATDAVNQTATSNLEVEIGQGTPQTSFTSPHPTYDASEIESIAFKASREGLPVEGATFKCGLDVPNNEPTKSCTTPFSLPEHVEAGWHTFVVRAYDKAGVEDPTPAVWKFNTEFYPPAPANEKLVYPEAGKKTASYYTLEAEWGANPEGKASEGVTGVWFQMKLPGTGQAFQTVPAECTIDSQGRQVSWPLPAPSHPGHSKPVFLKVRGCLPFIHPNYVEKEIEFRAVFDGGVKVAGASEPAATEFVYLRNQDRVSTDAVEAVGPASVDLLSGAFTISRTDVSIPVPGAEANLEYTRVYSSALDESLTGSVVGRSWQPSMPMESEYEGEAWTRIEEQIIPARPAVFESECWIEEIEEENEEEEIEISYERQCEEVEVEPPQPEERWIELFDNEGAAVPFEIVGEALVAPGYAKELKLTRVEGNIMLAYPNGTHTTFVKNGEHTWTPKYISYQSSPGKMRLLYEPVGPTQLKLLREIATPPGVAKCEDFESERTPGCRTLVFNYSPSINLLSSISYFGPTGNPSAKTTVAEYFYNGADLVGEQDPRLPNLKETYAYGAYGEDYFHQRLMTELTPPGQEPWTLGYEYGTGTSPSRLKSVSRAGATTTIAYNVPVSGAGAPYAMSAESIAKWGQSDLPVDATAIFPPTHVPSSYPPSEYSGASVHYMDPEGHQVNVGAPSPPGVEGPSIATTETDVHGNVVRELSPQNRLEALKAAEPVSRSRELDTHSVYNAQGTEMRESWGPLHSVKLGSGEVVEARQHTKISYDEGESPRPPGTPPAYLPTKEVTSATVPGKEGEFDSRVTETHYDWNFREPIETIVDPNGLNIRTVTEYNELGQVVQTRQPKNAEGGGAGTTKTFYYTSGSGPEAGCNARPEYQNLPCIVRPAAQASGSGRPELLVKQFKSYNSLDEPTEVIESPGGGSGNVRKTLTTYDAAGRQLTQKIEGAGQSVPTTKIEYSPTLGAPEKQLFVCESECVPVGTFQSAFGSAGTGNGQFNHPADVAVDSKGNIWVLDKGNNRIEEFNEKAEFVRAAGSEGSTGGKLKAPSAIAIDPSNNVWVADTSNNRIEEFNEKGEFVTAIGKDVNKTKVEAKGTEAERNFCSAASGNVCQAGPEGTAAGQLKAPQGIAATSTGKIWVADTGHSRLEKFGANGELVSNNFSEGSAPGQVKAPTAVAIGPDGSLWVADTGNNRIERWWGSELTLARDFGTEGTGNGQFKHPDALEVDASGNVWVGDEGNNRVEKFGDAGNFLGKFGSFGSGAGQFSLSAAPIGLASDPKGNIWITDPGNNRMERWSPTNAFDTQATSVEYNALGQVKSYEDADGNIAKTTYDAYGRPVTTTDNKGSQTVTYDPLSGVMTKLEDSAAGLFTAAYNADGAMIKRGLPDGLTATTSYNAAGEPIKLAYTKSTYCGASCTWLEETLERSVNGQIVSDNGTLVNDSYSYDSAGRLTEARETPAGGTCTTRAYTYDADSNRLSKATRAPGVGGACVTSGGTKQEYSYDGADRLEGPTYDPFGRITVLPAEFAGGKSLRTSYYSTDMVASQTEGTVSNAFELDASLRQRSRLQGGGLEGTEIFHYDGASDTPSWTERNTTWSRNITGIGGELAAVQDSSAGTMLRLTDLHGDVVAVAELSPTATKLKEGFRFDEFGNPMSGSAGRFGWLGGKARRTELSSGVIQMGARSYVPALGRFLTPDPVPEGSANPYDYANQDPVNGFDLEGTCSTKKGCAAARRKVKAKASKAIARVRVTMRKVRERRTQRATASTRQRATASTTHIGPVPITLPWENQVNEVLHTAQSAIGDLFAESCSDAGGALGAAGFAASITGRGLMNGSPGEKAVGGVLVGLGDVLGLAGTGLYAAHKFGVC